MKRILFTIIAVCVAFMVNAQTIHWLTFIDTTAKDVGHYDVTGRKVLYSRFINVINAALAEKGYNSDVQDFYDYRTSPENCKRAVESLNCRPDDIVVFYYIGHGARPGDDDDNLHPFPYMSLASNNLNKMIPLEWVHKTLKNKGARLTVTIGMCCNSYALLPIKRAPTFGVSYGNTYLNEKQLVSIQRMFLQHKGDFMLSSASPGQPSFPGITSLGTMDYFTAALVTIFDELAARGDLSWTSLFDNVKVLVNEITNGEQTPMFVSNITSVSQPSAHRREQPKKGGLDLQNADEVGNLLTQCLDFMIDKKQPIEKRIEISEQLQKLFIPNAQVKVMSRDGDVVVDKESVEDFLGRVVTSRILLKVVPTEYRTTSTQLTELKVKEYYKK